MPQNYLSDDEEQGPTYVSAAPYANGTQDALDLIEHARRAGSNSVDEFLQRPDQRAVQRPPQTVTMARLIQKNMNVPALRAAYSGNQR